MAQGPQGQWNAERPWPTAGTGANNAASWVPKPETETEAPTVTEDMEHVDLEAKVWTGSVKSFNQEKGWGHIECAETEQMYGKDPTTWGMFAANGSFWTVTMLWIP